MNRADTANEIYDHITQDSPRLDVDGRGYWVVEGDILLDQDSVRVYAIEEAMTICQEDHTSNAHHYQGLVGASGEDGRIIRWRKEKILSYRIDRASFMGNADQYQLVCAGMIEATQDWENACAVNFRHVKEMDEGIQLGMEPPVFDVQMNRQRYDILACAFFPNRPAHERHIYVFPPFFDLSVNRYGVTGVLRHELGHVLGFRHEHIRKEEFLSYGAYKEKVGHIVPLTPYDYKSVMHYIFPEATTENVHWVLTDFDIQGARRVYGAPHEPSALPEHRIEYCD